MQRIIIKVFILQDYKRFALVLTKKGLDNDEHIWSNWVIEMKSTMFGAFYASAKEFVGTIQYF